MRSTPPIAAALGLALLCLCPRVADAQGCVSPARAGCAIIGTHAHEDGSGAVIPGEGSPYLQEDQWQLGFGYRYFKSHRHFIGDDEAEEFEDENREFINWVHLLNFNATYAITQRINVAVDMPVLIADRSSPITDPDDPSLVIGRNVTGAEGIGDISLTPSLWLFEPESHPGWNISLGLGVKFPTGEDDVVDGFADAAGNIALETVDQSIQPGDGGFGAILNVSAFASVFDTATLYFQGIYLANPRNTNHVPTFRVRDSESELSVTDAFFARLGLALPVWPSQGLSFTLGGRLEGVPVYDILGDSDGFRRPGLTVAVEPGLTWVVGRHAFSLTAPISVYRNRFQSVPDRMDGVHGDAGFADYQIVFNYNFRFGGNAPEAMEPASPQEPPRTSFDLLQRD